jgi:predicted transglutaminase-like cysteine proteinase
MTKRGRNWMAAMALSLLFWAIIISAVSSIAFGAEIRPVGHSIFCIRWPEECTKAEEAKTDRLDVLASVNASINRKPYRQDRIKRRSAEVWGMGQDCEEYAIQKRRALIAKGIPAGALKIAVGTAGRERHAVLIAETTAGRLVLDNMTAEILPLSKSAFKVDAMATANPAVWRKM